MAENIVIVGQSKPVTENYEVVHQKSEAFYPEYARKSDLKIKPTTAPDAATAWRTNSSPRRWKIWEFRTTPSW